MLHQEIFTIEAMLWLRLGSTIKLYGQGSIWSLLTSLGGGGVYAVFGKRGRIHVYTGRVLLVWGSDAILIALGLQSSDQRRVTCKKKQS